MLTNLAAKVLQSIVKRSKLEMMAEVEELIERDGETCAQTISNELGVDLKTAGTLIRGLLNAEGIFKGEEREIAGDLHQFYTSTRPRNTINYAPTTPAMRDPLVAALFGEA